MDFFYENVIPQIPLPAFGTMVVSTTTAWTIYMNLVAFMVLDFDNTFPWMSIATGLVWCAYLLLYLLKKQANNRAKKN